MEFVKISPTEWIALSSITRVVEDGEYKHTTYYKLYTGDGNYRTVLAPKGTSIEDAICQRLTTINKDNNEQSAHTTPTLR